MKTLLLAAGILAATGIAAQQAPPPAAAPIARFEAASVKRNTSGNTFMTFSAQPERLFLSQQLGRPVRDETGIDGAYDLTLTFMPDSTGRGMPIGPPLPGAPELPPIDPNAPSLITAVQEQLGLKLETARSSLEVMVIDRIEQPTED